MMNIVLVGILDRKGSSNVSQAKAFMKLGFEVIPINYRTIIRDHGAEFFENIIVDCIKEHEPYLTIFSKCNGINPNIINECSKYSTTWLWFMDSHKIAEGARDVIEHAKRTHLCSCTSDIAVDLFRKHGAVNCQRVLEGADPEYYKPVPSVKEYEADISFIGTRTAERDNYKKVLEGAGYNVKFYGAGYDSGEFRSWPKICSSSKFILSLNTFNNIPGYFSGRVFESLACQACTLHLDSTGTLNEFFEDGKEIVYFKDEKDLLDKLKSIDANTAKEIAINGRQRILNEYTWHHSVQKVLQITDQYNGECKGLQDMIIEDTVCKACNKDDFKYIASFPTQTMVNTPEGARLRTYAPEVSRCNTCGVAFANKRVKWDSLKASQKTSLPSSFVDIKGGEKKKRERKENAEHQLGLINKYVEKPGKILDIGAAAGCFLAVARAQGWDVRGTEISSTCVKTAMGHYSIELFEGEVQEFKEEGFDAIVLWNVLEHFYWPYEDIRHLVSLLKEEGVVLFKTPNHTEKTLLEHSMLPHHVFNFDPKSIDYLFDKVGLKILEIVDDFDGEVPIMEIVAGKK